jgi:2-keto-4-pentenoate hydratase/2-oxohepta-3-ene-1,7-dioic acid hydratase in catechol pathway
MLWTRYRSKDGRVGFGIAAGEHITEYAGDMFGVSRATDRSIARNECELLCPCVPSKIVALWNNFGALSLKLGKALPTHPLFFLKPSTSVIGSGENIRRPAGYAGKIVFEGELGIVVGKICKEVQPDCADEYIFGYTCVNDVTAAGVLNENVDFAQWCRAKSYDSFACLGPVIATGLDWQSLRVVTRLDGLERQNYPLSDMTMSPRDLISRLSHDMTLLPGDVIACGTSLGAGSMTEGSSIEVSIEGIGSLTNVLSGRPG